MDPLFRTLVAAVLVAASSPAAALAQAAPDPGAAFEAAVADGTAALSGRTHAVGKALAARHGDGTADGVALFRLKLEGGGRPPREVSFRFSGCEPSPRNDYQPPYTTCRYKGDADYDLLAVTDEGGRESELFVVSASRGGAAAAGRLGRLDLQRVQADAWVDLGEVTLPDPAGGADVKVRAALLWVPLRAQPTNHVDCPPETCQT